MPSPFQFEQTYTIRGRRVNVIRRFRMNRRGLPEMVSMQVDLIDGPAIVGAVLRNIPAWSMRDFYMLGRISALAGLGPMLGGRAGAVTIDATTGESRPGISGVARADLNSSIPEPLRRSARSGPLDARFGVAAPRGKHEQPANRRGRPEVPEAELLRVAGAYCANVKPGPGHKRAVRLKLGIKDSAMFQRRLDQAAARGLLARVQGCRGGMLTPKAKQLIAELPRASKRRR